MNVKFLQHSVFYIVRRNKQQIPLLQRKQASKQQSAIVIMYIFWVHTEQEARDEQQMRMGSVELTAGRIDQEKKVVGKGAGMATGGHGATQYSNLISISAHMILCNVVC